MDDGEPLSIFSLIDKGDNMVSENNQQFETIAAVSTAIGNAGISIIRISGAAAFHITSTIFKGMGSFLEYPSHTINYGKIVDPDSDEIIDEVLVSKMESPKTYTTEDIVEINCHGGYVTAKRILDLLFRRGARPAEAGEFTKRAFLNGRIDLVQAEAIMDLIGAITEKSSTVAVTQLEGRLSQKLNSIRKKLIEILAEIEVNLDYPEYDFEEVTIGKCVNIINENIVELEGLIESFDYGKVLREGINIAIIGKPNAGKSSLLNRLSGKNRAIVTDIPGTTRDVIEEYVNIRGIPINLLDTAGLRQATDEVEKIGVEKALEVMTSADLILFVLDAQTGFEKKDKDILQNVSEVRDKTIFVVNKTDKTDEQRLKEIHDIVPGVIEISVLEDSRIDVLEKAIQDYVNKTEIDTQNQVIITNARHKKLLIDTVDSLKSALFAADGGMTLDLISMDIKEAAERIGNITGHEISEEIVMNIFERFCIGK